MLRTTALPAAALLGLSLLAPTTATAVAPTTCRGQAVTIDGRGAAVVEGTEGNDVIVSDGADVRALGGDDTICITGHTSPYVYAGPGNDVVDATAATGGTTTTLGDGDDTFLGSAAHDTVIAGAGPNDDDGHDVIDTGPRAPVPDVVESGTGGQPNPDEIEGGWMQLFWVGVATPTSRLDGGEGSTLRMDHANGVRNLAIDTDAGTLGAGAYRQLELRGFTDFLVRDYRALRVFLFQGTSSDERVDLSSSRRVQVRIKMEGGDDQVQVGGFAGTSRFDGGTGRDRIYTGSRSKVALNLARGQLRTVAGGKTVHVRANRFEDAILAAPRVSLTGTDGANTLEVNACRATVRGLRGRDEISAFDKTPDGSRVRCRAGRRMHLLGGPGADDLVGSRGRDVLIGGPGRDRADGARSRDVCLAERTKRCEVRR